MKVLDFLQQHPAQAIEVLTGEGFTSLTAMGALELARRNAPDQALLEMEVLHTSFSGGAWHVIAAEPVMKQELIPAMF